MFEWSIVELLKQPHTRKLHQDSELKALNHTKKIKMYLSSQFHPSLKNVHDNSYEAG